MASELLVNKITPESGSTLTLGDSGDTISFASGVLPSLESLTITGDLTVDTDTFKVDSTNNRVGVGTTSPSVTFDAEADGATVAHFNRATSDGDIIELQKDGTTVGSIGVASSDLNIYGDVGIKFSGDDVRPTDSSGNNSDNAVDLGHFDVRWQDLYLGGSVYLGGTGSANALDDYEEGTWTPTYEPASGSFTSITYDSQAAEYVKIGRLVYVTGRLRTDAITVGTASGTVRISGLPFTTDGTNFRGVTTIYGSSWGTNRPNFVLTLASATQLALYRHNEPNDVATVTVTDMGTGANSNNIYFNCVYQIAG